MGEIAAEAWTGNLSRNCSRIVDIFQFQVRSELSFPDVDFKSLKFDPMMYLSLPIPPSMGSLDLEDCLEEFTRSEELEREDWVKCDKTGEVERTVKRLDVWSLPDCLIIHLKRFRTERLGGISKVETDVRAP